MWRAADAAPALTFAFAVTGVSETPAPGAHPSFNAIEEALVRMAFDVAKASAHPHGDDPRPFDETRDAAADVDAALAAASASGKRVLLVLGGNWCHDSRGLAAKFAAPDLSQIIDASYELVWVDVGYRDRNLDIPKRFNAPDLIGTPTILILTHDGMLANRQSVHDWRNADSRTLSEAVAYFRAHAP